MGANFQNLIFTFESWQNDLEKHFLEFTHFGDDSKNINLRMDLFLKLGSPETVRPSEDNLRLQSV